MTLVDLKALAEKFRAVADDKHAVTKLADDNVKKYHGDAVVVDLCNHFKAAKDATAIKNIANEVKSRTHV